MDRRASKKSFAEKDDASDKKNLAYTLLNVALNIFFVALLVWGYFYFEGQNRLPLRKIKVVAPFIHFSQNTVEEAINPYIKNNFVTLNTMGLRKIILQIPWVHNVSIQRLWPDKILINIEEQNAIALWNDNSLINQDGALFNVPSATIPNNLPHLIGKNSDIKHLLSIYQTINEKIKPFNLQISNFTMDNAGGWQITLSNGTLINANDSDGMAQLTLFFSIYPRLMNAEHKTATLVDVRYKNGFAVKWQ